MTFSFFFASAFFDGPGGGFLGGIVDLCRVQDWNNWLVMRLEAQLHTPENETRLAETTHGSRHLGS